MTTSDSNNIEQEVDGAFRSAITQAAALGRMVAQLREQSLQRAARREDALAAEMQRRYESERQYARVILSQADHDGWWNTASTERVASVVATAQAWKDRDPEIARLSSRLDDRARARWGITPTGRIDALTPAQRRQEAQHLVATLSLDQLDKDDPLHTIAAELRQPEEQIDQNNELESSQPDNTNTPEGKEGEQDRNFLPDQEAENVTVELTTKERDFLVERLGEYESRQIDEYEEMDKGEQREFGADLYDNAQYAVALQKKLRPMDAARGTESRQKEQRRVMEQDEPVTRDTREQSIDEFEQLMRSNGMDEETIKARMLAERANAKSVQEAANIKPSTAGKPKNRAGRSHNLHRDAERGR